MKLRLLRVTQNNKNNINGNYICVIIIVPFTSLLNNE